MAKYIAVGIGELLWDMLPDGKQMGGAPANFIFHTYRNGIDGFIISCAGKDALGDEIVDLIKSSGLDPLYIDRADHPTGTVNVFLKNGVPTYNITENVAWDYIRLTDQALNLAEHCDAVCFGTLAQRNDISRIAIQSFLKNTREGCFRVFDVNFRNPFYSKQVVEESLNLANCLKLNDEELIVMAKMFDLKGSTIEKCKRLLSLFDLQIVALTKGAAGSTLLTENEVSALPVVENLSIVDTIGAGVAFTASMVSGLLNKQPLEEIHNQANQRAAFVCTRKGAMPKT